MFAMVMILGIAAFILVFVMIAPKSQVFLLGLATDAGTFIHEWAPFSYILMLLVVAALFVGIWLLRTWPVRVDEGNPMAKYRQESPPDDD